MVPPSTRTGGLRPVIRACTAQEMTYRAAQKAAQQGKKFLGDLEDDTQASGALAMVPPSTRTGGLRPGIRPSYSMLPSF